MASNVIDMGALKLEQKWSYGIFAFVFLVNYFLN
jgi:hypothetical protein